MKIFCSPTNRLAARLAVLLFLLLPFAARAQTLRGTVRDADRGQALRGVAVELQPERSGASFLVGVTDSAGAFVFDRVLPGYYRLELQAEGYERFVLAQIDVAAGKDRSFDLVLRPLATTLPDVTVTARGAGQRAPQPLSEIPLTREQTLRFPATFFDPARLAMAYPGVLGTDDQANGLSIRGHGPAALKWRLEGVDVVNPNHLTNAGTFSDRPALSSGGVLMFSAQLLDQSALLTGNFPAGYGDALGGVMDVGLRRGNPHRHEFTAQAGLLGLDVAAEGPLGRGEKHAFLANYRYSTVGLLADMGISFGDETIRFQDLSFKLDFSGKKGGQWSVFGLGATNETLFTRKAEADVEQYKDLFDIEFRSATALAGVSNWTPLGRNGWLKTALVFSGQTNERLAEGDGRRETDDQDEGRAGLSTTLSTRFSPAVRLLAGVQAQAIRFDLEARTDETLRPSGALEGALLQPWINFEFQGLRDRLVSNWGVHTSLWQPQGDDPGEDETLAQLEPRLSFELRLSPRQRLSLALGYYSQLNPLWAYALETPGASGTDRFPYRSLGFMRSLQAGLGYRYMLSENWSLRAEYFQQELTRVPVTVAPSAFSMVNVSEIQPLDSLQATGKARHRGLELTAERYLSGGWFLLANTTWLDAIYRGSDYVWRDSRWNVGYILNLTVGKEWQREIRPGRVSAFGANVRAGLNGGQRARPVDVAASTAAGTTVYDGTGGYTEKQPAFFRLDARAYWKRSLDRRRNSMLAFDFQNATFQTNTAYYFYDPYTRRVELKEQLGLVPNLSWRLEF